MKINYIHILLILTGVLTFVSCEKISEEDFQSTVQEYFYDSINVENFKEQYIKGDTIWFSANIKDELLDFNSGEQIILKNQTYILAGVINLLMPQYDSLFFLDQNIDIVEDIGEIQLINVLNSTPPSYTFDMRFGKPLNSNEIRFGIIPNYPGIFGVEFEGWVYYGSERDDFDDFSFDNHKGYLDLSFSGDNINDSVFYALPPEYLYNYEPYYNSVKVSNKKFFFLDIIEE